MTTDYGAEWSAGLRRADADELRGWLEFAIACADVADELALGGLRRELTVEAKADGSFVTQVDKLIETTLRSRLTERFPDHDIVGEEYGTAVGASSTRWYVDPIDGTHNYMRGVPLFATLLAAERDGELQAAVVSAPALRTRWYGWRGGGTWAVEAGGAPRQVGVSQIAVVEEAQVVYAGTIDVEDSGLAPGFRALRERAWRERGFGDFWGHLLVAEGAAEAMVEIDLSPWDYAAPKLLVEEAGGRVTDFGGRRELDGRTFLATNGIIHETVRAMLASGTEGS